MYGSQWFELHLKSMQVQNVGKVGEAHGIYRYTLCSIEKGSSELLVIADVVIKT